MQEVNDEGIPNLIAVHRFRWSILSSEQKMKQTLYHVNKLEKGDVVYIVWNKQLYTYYVQDIVEGVNNPQNDAGLVIYTCRFMRSRERIFVLLE